MMYVQMKNGAFFPHGLYTPGNIGRLPNGQPVFVLYNNGSPCLIGTVPRNDHSQPIVASPPVVTSPPALPSSRIHKRVVTELKQETDPHRLAQRAKQIGFGKVTKGYANYLKQVPKESRNSNPTIHPVTPRIDQLCSKRKWDHCVSSWRRDLHNWDSPESRDPAIARPSPVEILESSQNSSAGSSDDERELLATHAAAETQTNFSNLTFDPSRLERPIEKESSSGNGFFFSWD